MSRPLSTWAVAAARPSLHCLAFTGLLMACQPASLDADTQQSPSKSGPTHEEASGDRAQASSGTPVRSGAMATGAGSSQTAELQQTLAPAPLVQSVPRKFGGSATVEGSRFGMSVAVHAGQVSVGAPAHHIDNGDAGYVFHDEAGNWVQRAQLSPTVSNAAMGSAASIDGTTAAFGAPHAALNALPEAGAVYIHTRSASSWAPATTLRATPSEAYATFGMATALDGATLTVGAPNHGQDTSVPWGRAFVFERSGSIWSQTAVIAPAAESGAQRRFGDALSIDADTLLVGAPRYVDEAGTASGAAYVFVRSAGAWSQEAKLTASDSAFGDRFGTSVSIHGDRALIGAPNNRAPWPGAGAAYLFSRSAKSWNEEQKLELGITTNSPSSTLPPIHAAEGVLPSLNFGQAVGLSADMALVTAPWLPTTKVEKAGAGYLFRRGGASWTLSHVMRAPVPVTNSAFGWSATLTSEYALIGAPIDSSLNGPGTGAAYLFGIVQHGAACDEDNDCADALCTGGVCCNSACTGPCERCDQPGSLGICSPTPAGALVSTCGPYLCDGGQSACPQSCKRSDECSADHFCDQSTCLPKQALSSPCVDGDGCASGFCSDGVCCDNACDGPCEQCNGIGASGTCSLLTKGEAGSPSCAPGVCSGASATCAGDCTDESDCAPGRHCAASQCVPDLDDGEACNDAQMCLSTLCTDGLCCISEDCAPFRCGPGGTCHTSCSSTANCASGFECTSERQCVAAKSAPQGEEGSEAGCSVGKRGLAGEANWQAWMLLAGLAWARRREH